MENLINNIANLPLSWSILFLLFASAIAYYWFTILPKIKKFDTQDDIIQKVIPKIGEDITKAEELFEKSNDIFFRASEALHKLESGLAIALKEQNEIKRLLLLSMQNTEPAPSSVRAGMGRAMAMSMPSVQQGFMEDMTIDQIRAMLQQDRREKTVTDTHLSRLQNALSIVENEVEDVRDDQPFKSLLKNY